MESLSPTFRQISFHDPEGNIFEHGGKLFRRVSPEAGYRLQKFIATRLCVDLVAEKLIPATKMLTTDDLSTLAIGNDASNSVWFEHERIRFVSYAHEWIPEMLFAAAELTLSLVKRLHAVGWDLKDASASNVVFHGTTPIFVDLCSIVERRQDQPYWWPKGQFERHFILPLLAYIHRRLPPAKIHFSSSDGLDPVALSGLLGLKRWTSLLAVKHCALPTLLASLSANGKRRRSVSGLEPRACALAQEWQLQSLEKSMQSIRGKFPKAASNWHAYTVERDHYTHTSLDEKRGTVERWLKQSAPSTVLDLGANTGEFSLLATSTGARVISLENDLDSARIAFQNARAAAADCHVLLQDLGNPSPAMGWCLAEKKSLDQRIEGEVDCVLALALIHHWLVSAAIPLPAIVAQLARWTRRFVIIEYVAPDDPMFQALCAQRQVVFTWLDRGSFRKALTADFAVLEEVDLAAGGRVLFYCERLL